MIFINEREMRLGNLLFKIAYDLKHHSNNRPIDETIYYVDGAQICNFKDMFYIECRPFKRINVDAHIDFNKILNPGECDFIKLKDIIDYPYLNRYDNELTSEEYLCIHCRYGDYLNHEYCNTYKRFSPSFLNKVLEEYKDDLQRYSKVYVISDNIELAKEETASILTHFFGNNITYFHESLIRDFNLLLHANAIIGSCSTFTFAGFYLNVENAKLYVEYPYYKYPNKHNFPKDAQKELYNNERIIKLTL